MADERANTRFTAADLDRLEAKMRTPPPPIMQLRPSPGGTLRAAGDAYARDQQAQLQARMKTDLSQQQQRPLRMEPPAQTRTSFTMRDLDRSR